MIETLLRIGATFDWISPALAAVQDIANGPTHTFLIPAAGVDVDVIRMLKRCGVKAWGNMIINGTLTVSVRKSQARYAYYLLQRAGVTVENPPRGVAWKD